MTRRRVVVTGRGVVSPLGVGVGAHVAAARAGSAMVGPIERLGALGLAGSRGGEVAPGLLAPHLARLPRKQQKLYNRGTLLAMLAASLAMEEAGLGPGAGAAERLGVVLGVDVLAWDLGAMTEYLAAAESPGEPGRLDMASANRFCMQRVNPIDFSLKTLPNLSAGHLAIAHDARGFCRALSEGPTGGAEAVGQAFRLVADGDLDVALCGGAEAPLEELVYASYQGLGRYGPGADGPAAAAPGEAAGLLVLEEAGRAERRGAALRGELVGYATAAGDRWLGPDDEPGPVVSRLAEVIGAAVAEAGTRPDVVVLDDEGVTARGRAETRALAQALGVDERAPRRLALSSLHGHLGVAAAPVALATCCATLLDDATLGSALVVSVGLFGECAAVMVAGPGGHGAR